MKKDKPKEFVVYRISHIDSGKSYIGITTNYKKRMQVHFNSHNTNSYLHRTIKKHGKENFKHEIIFECNSWKELCEEETEYIKIFNTKAPNGYNLTDGGEGTLGRLYSLETRKKIGKMSKNRFVSEKTRKKMSDAKLNMSLETRKKISESNKNKIVSNETRKKMSETRKGFVCSKEAKQNMSIAQQNKSNKTKQKIAKTLSIFSKEQIIEIKQMLINGVFQKDIAKKFNVVQSTIGSIKRGEHYSWIQTPGVGLNDLLKGKRKLTDKQILEVRKMLLNKISQREIAEKFNISNSTIGCIKRNERYTDIQLPKEET